MRKALQLKTLSVNKVEHEKRCQHDCHNNKEHNVRLCKTDYIKIDEEFEVNYTDLGKQIMIVDCGSPLSLTGKNRFIQ